jgi:hypothetical protein
VKELLCDEIGHSHRGKSILAYKKLSPRRLSAIPGPRAKKPPVRQQNRELAELIAEEIKLAQTLASDASVRLAFQQGAGEPYDPLLIWTDFDLTHLHTELDAKNLDPWVKLSEWMKLELGFLLGLRVGGMAFTANVHVSHIEKWSSEGMSVSQLTQKRLKKEIDKSGLGSLPYCYVIETRTKWGKSRTKPHLHGILLADDRRDYTKFKLAVERALLSGDLRGNSKKVTMTFDNLYDHKGSDRYVSYITKNVHRWDARIKGRSVYMSRPFTQTVREFWALIREEPVA